MVVKEGGCGSSDNSGGTQLQQRGGGDGSGGEMVEGDGCVDGVA